MSYRIMPTGEEFVKTRGVGAGTVPLINDASPVASTDEFRMRRDIHNAPMGKLLLLINEGGKLTLGTLNVANKSHFVEWQRVPKRALPEEFEDA